jgi:hypothetical protein
MIFLLDNRGRVPSCAFESLVSSTGTTEGVCQEMGGMVNPGSPPDPTPAFL